MISNEGSIDRNFKVIKNNAIGMLARKRTCLRRALLGMLQEQLRTGLNITFQPVQKSEPCASRISNWRRYDISQILDVPKGYLFENMSLDTIKIHHVVLAGAVKSIATKLSD